MEKRIPDELSGLLDLAPSESTPLLLELSRRQVARRRPAELLGQLERDRFVHPSFLDQRLINRLDAVALEAAPDFEAVQLSPVAPLGACSVVAPTSQDRTLSTTRGTEVVSDPTNVLALLSAQRLKRASDVDVKLCTVHQTLRAQALPPTPGFSRHFRLFVLTEAGRARAEDGFEVDAIARQVAVFNGLMDAYATVGATFRERTLTVLSTPGRSTMAERVCARIAASWPQLRIRSESFTHAYYDGLRVTFSAHSSAGEPVPIGDTGVFDWMPRLTANGKLRLVASGFGVQLVPALFCGAG